MIIRISTALMCVVALVVSGCNKPDDNFQKVSEADAAKAEQSSKDHVAAHVHTAPHGGELIALGDHKFNVELVLGEDRTLTAYVLGGHAEKAVAIEQKTLSFDIEGADGEIEIKMLAEPQEGDEEGKSSRFVAKADTVPEVLKSLEGTHGHVHISIGGTDFVGELDHDEPGHGKDGDKDANHKHDGKDNDGDDDKSDKAAGKS